MTRGCGAYLIQMFELRIGYLQRLRGDVVPDQLTISVTNKQSRQHLYAQSFIVQTHGQITVLN
jgi:hypothetical protein